ncbi:MAG: hypothetical protein LUQ40_03850 [Methanomicrobiales archaeon]|nr:hypothetical protein [Methanomicrobiales archaeon]
MSEERISDLEGKMKELEALIKGLTDEMLDLKSILMKLSRRDDERRAAVPAPRMPSEVTVRPRKPTAVAEQPRQQQPKDTGEMELIMQTDGTLKPERRSESNNFIVASARFNPNISMRNKGNKGKISEEEPKKEASDLIYAVDEDPKKKK